MNTVGNDRVRDIEGAERAHARLSAGVDGLTDEQARGPSLLPGWTVGHVLTHLARNADGIVRMLGGAERGMALTQYEGGAASRQADIDAGAARSADELVADVRDGIGRLERSWADAPEAAWAIEGIGLMGPILLADSPFRRWREVEIHRVDLGVEVPAPYRFTDWPADYLRLELIRQEMTWASRRPMGLTSLPPEALAADPPNRLAWLVGRGEIAGLAPAGIF